MLHIRTCASHLIARIATLSIAVGSFAATSLAVTPAPFTPNTPLGGAPIGFSYAGNKFVGTILGDGTGRIYSTDLNGGNVQPFGGTISLNASYGQEHYVSSSLGLGGFPSRDVYVASGNNIHHITNAGVPDAGLFVNGSLGGINGDVRGITFDAVGTFGYKMIVTTHTGYVYTIDPSGNPTQIAFTGEDTEGLDIAPLGAGSKWGGLDGALFVASEGSGSIRAIKPVSFAMSLVTTVASAEQLDFVPLNLGASGNPLEGMYSANYAVNVLKAPATDFTTMMGDIIVTGETTAIINNVTNTIGGVVVSNVGSFPNQPEDGLFVTADIINAPEPGSLALLGAGAMFLLGRSRRRSR